MAAVIHKSKRHKRRPMGEINVVPYIDVMLVLLVIFMVTAPMLTQGVNVDLPKAEAKPATQKQEQKNVVITVEKDGSFHIQYGTGKAERMDISEMTARVAAYREMDSKPGKPVPVYLEGDKEAKYEWIISALASLQKAGVEGVGLLTDPPEPEKGAKKK